MDKKTNKKGGIQIIGDGLIELRKKDGTVICREEVLGKQVVLDGKERVAKLIGAVGSADAFSALAIGTGTTSPVEADTTLETEVARVSATVAYEASYKVTFEKTFTFGSGESYSITEAGLFDSITASGSVMLDRFTFGAKAVDDDTDLYVKVTITVTAV